MTSAGVSSQAAPGGATQQISWRIATVLEVVRETPGTRTLVLDVPGWPGHRAGQHVDVRLTAEDGYQTERSYSIASPPEDSHLALTVERLDDGEVSPYLTDELHAGDGLELRGPIGGYFVWDFTQSNPLFLAAGGSRVMVNATSTVGSLSTNRCSSSR
jgi:ferredoxin-NADP reductase